MLEELRNNTLSETLAHPDLDIQQITVKVRPNLLVSYSATDQTPADLQHTFLAYGRLRTVTVSPQDKTLEDTQNRAKTQLAEYHRQRRAARHKAFVNSGDAPVKEEK